MSSYNKPEDITGNTIHVDNDIDNLLNMLRQQDKGEINREEESRAEQELIKMRRREASRIFSKMSSDKRQEIIDNSLSRDIGLLNDRGASLTKEEKESLQSEGYSDNVINVLDRHSCDSDMRECTIKTEYTHILRLLSTEELMDVHATIEIENNIDTDTDSK